jgi:hypothetical protein
LGVHQRGCPPKCSALRRLLFWGKVFPNNPLLWGNVIAKKHFLEEDILDNKKHEQDKEKTYGTLNICGVN